MAMIQWFPGHMHLTQKAITERVKAIDVVIELLDARLPGSSANPMLAKLTQGKPALKVLNKQDLADPERTALWLAYYNAQPGTRAIALADDFYLYDTPGVLWPRIIVAKSGYNLAASGAVGRNAFDEQEVALELLDYLRQHYPAPLESRYRLNGVAQMGDEQLLHAIGEKRGALQGGKTVNLQKAAEIVIFDFRAMALGRITLEAPDEFARWLAAGQMLDAQRQQKKDAIELDRKIRFRQVPRPNSRGDAQ